MITRKRIFEGMQMLIVATIVVLILNTIVNLGIKVAISINKIDQLETTIKAQEKEIKELWNNIDALSEDYTTLWIHMYGEDSWHE